MAEAGIPGYEYIGWYGMLALAATPAAVIERLNVELNKILQQPAVAQRFEADGAQPVGGTPAQFGEHIKSEISKWAKVVKHARMRVD